MSAEEVPALAHGVPAVVGRWQPTRAGVVNSWQWTDEEFHFADGWLAFVGRNGSGKSLTASQLVTVLLDGDTTQTALSVSGRAAGTLMSRHTDSREKDDKTGVWWLEYGFTDPVTEQTEYLTSGLWMRSSGQSLLRAFFLVPGRTGDQLTLQADRNVASIENLAEQLAANNGELFTDAQRLKPKAAARLTAISPEHDYRIAVRTRLFAPLDEVQYEALLSVLRTLRSVRTAEKISARDMLDVLTGALPALDQAKLSEIAGAMQRIATLEGQLADTKEQSRKLAATDRVYELYRRAVALTAAARLRYANTEFDNLTRSERTAAKTLSDAETEREQAIQAQVLARDALSRAEGDLSGAETALRDHAGAELPLLEQRAADLESDAEAAKKRAGQAKVDSDAARALATRAVQNASSAQQSLVKITHELTTTARQVQGESTLTNLLSTTEELTAPSQLDPSTAERDIKVDELVATPLAWVEMRKKNAENVSTALNDLNTANQLAVGFAEQQRAAQSEQEQRGETLREYSAARDQAEQRLETAITEWQRSSAHFPLVPDALFEPDSIDERVNPESLTQWLDQQAAAIGHQLDVPGHRARKETSDLTAKQDAESAAELQAAAGEAAEIAAGAQTHLDEQVEQARLAAEQDAETARQAEEERDQHVAAAQQSHHDRRLAQLRQAESALEAVTTWAEQVQRWRSGLRHLDRTALLAPEPLTEQVAQLLTELRAARTAARTTYLDRTAPVVALAERSLTTLTEYDDRPLRAALADAAQDALGRLDRKVIEAESVVSGLKEQKRVLNVELAEARRAPAPPPAPAWRTRSGGSPLWSLVDFKQGVPPETRDRCEGALLVSGVLDAVVTADGRARSGDAVLTGDHAAAGASLADILVVEQESPIDQTLVRMLLRSVSFDGTTVRSGVLTAAAPAGYDARYIGTTARERARAERVADLEAQVAELASRVEAAEIQLSRQRDAVSEAKSEKNGLPPATLWRDSLTLARTAQSEAHEAEHEAANLTMQADSALRFVLEGLATAKQSREQVLTATRSELDKAVALAEQAARMAGTAVAKAASSANHAQAAAVRFDNAVTKQATADADRLAFPSFRDLLAARENEDEATLQMDTARALVVAADEQMRKAQGRTREALTALNRAVDLGNGRMLPAEPAALKTFKDSLTQLADQIHSWQWATDRAVNLCGQARSSTDTALTLSERAEEGEQEAATAHEVAVGAKATVARIKELHGAEYQELSQAYERSTVVLSEAKTEVEHVRGKIHQAEVAAATAKATLENIAPQRELAEKQREECLLQMNQLVDESVATVEDGISTDEAGRPANLTAALSWGARMLSAESGTHHRDELAKLLDSRRTRLETEAKKVSAELIRFDRQVTLQTIPGTDWRRAVVAAPEALGGEDLHTTVLTLRQTAEQLEGDLREDVKATLKTSMFTALRRDIATRRAAAQELVRQISAALADVRTGVARVGVEVDWKVKDDPDAQRMVDLVVTALPSDETFEQMYNVLRHRLEEAAGDTWEARVAQTFDYRVWHEWEIKVTHKSFGDGTTEVFRPLTVRSNPLASFSTGEMRLATMLPLLAAAWSMYEAPGHQGPRLLFIDEMNAAFDPQNVRKLLALLREWNFDVLSTAPEMSAMLKAESKRVMIAQVTQAGSVRVTMPWLWTGSGRPILIADRIGGAGERS
ncbi:Putative exonuclease SbcCD, C subunit [Amycolatopsis xylanica]|uniref:Putative exonuclease SbcCD, C subunit n=1 Tax=Amycolatopsis xylanica TaxID=589385 RepID=A0A1H2SG14_9PSEU|nr:SbcC/MukB-like Walker B domain-containing protein [Amycolatopsis xylanica]SDW30643.1 Putative exonuclease SbcCD, C subunit [Amycolatopsis xylanica]